MTTNKEAVAQTDASWLNEVRAARAEAALLAYANVTSGEGYTWKSLHECPVTREEWFIDLLTDLRHWCHKNAAEIAPKDFNEIATLTEMHFNTEIDEEKKEGAQ